MTAESKLYRQDIAACTECDALSCSCRSGFSSSSAPLYVAMCTSMHRYTEGAYGCEQAVNPQKDIPFAIMLSMGTVTTLYVLMCMAITLAVPYAQIDKSAPFSVLFKTIDHWHWASYLVSVGAVLGVGTVVLVGPCLNPCMELLSLVASLHIKQELCRSILSLEMHAPVYRRMPCH